MSDMVIERELKLKKPIFKGDDRTLAVTIKKRKPRKKTDGRSDYSDLSELLRDIERTKAVEEYTLLTKDVADDLREKILRGLTEEQACNLCGVNYGTYSRWLTKYPLFKEYIRRIKAQVEFDTLEHIQEAMEGGSWQSAAWFLERKWPHRYGKRDVLKQQIYHVHMEFVRIVLDIVNNEDPSIKTRILDELKKRKIDLSGT